MLRFTIDKHNIRHVYWLKNDIYDTLKTSPYLHQQGDHGHIGFWDWEIVYDLIPMSNHCQHEHKVKPLMKSIERGDIIQPIIVVSDTNIIEGRHKAEAYYRLGHVRGPIARPVGEGSGKILRDEVYGHLVANLENIGDKPTEVRCIECGEVMEVKDKKLVCQCGRRVINISNLGWTVLNG